MAIHDDDLAALERAAVIGGDGEKLGAVAGVYFDNATNHPEWVAVRSGLFGLNVALVPLAAAELRGAELHVPFDQEQLKRAPHHEPGSELSPQDEIDLFRHYGVSYDAWADTPPAAEATGRAAPTAADEIGASAPSESSTMTRSEEQLRVRTESQALGRVRLRKHIVTEYQQITVPVRREEIRIEREPVGDAGDFADSDAGATSAGAAGRSVTGRVDPDASVPVDAEGEQEIILYAERPVVRTETVAVERIRLGKQTVTDQETVGGEVRREEIELDDGRGDGPDDVRR
jgi:stress response protein YsnF